MSYQPTPEQAATVAALDGLTDPDVTVDAGAVDASTDEPCEACPDGAPEVATVVFTLHGVGFDYCPGHAVAFLARELRVGDHVSPDVLRAEPVRNPLYQSVRGGTSSPLVTLIDGPGECGLFCVICTSSRAGTDEYRWRPGLPTVDVPRTTAVPQ